MRSSFPPSRKQDLRQVTGSGYRQADRRRGSGELHAVPGLRGVVDMHELAIVMAHLAPLPHPA